MAVEPLSSAERHSELSPAARCSKACFLTRDALAFLGVLGQAAADWRPMPASAQAMLMTP